MARYIVSVIYRLDTILNFKNLIDLFQKSLRDTYLHIPSAHIQSKYQVHQCKWQQIFQPEQCYTEYLGTHQLIMHLIKKGTFLWWADIMVSSIILNAWQDIHVQNNFISRIYHLPWTWLHSGHDRMSAAFVALLYSVPTKILKLLSLSPANVLSILMSAT